MDGDHRWRNLIVEIGKCEERFRKTYGNQQNINDVSSYQRHREIRNKDQKGTIIRIKTIKIERKGCTQGRAVEAIAKAEYTDSLALLTNWTSKKRRCRNRLNIFDMLYKYNNFK